PNREAGRSSQLAARSPLVRGRLVSFVRDTVLIPSGFRPGPATTTVRIPVGERASWRGSEGARSTLFLRRDVTRGLERRAVRGGEIGIGIGNHKYSEEEQGEGTEADERLEDLDSLRQSLLGAEGTL
ncbi:unnamed protein product, partial [Ascophyllum nodosum]